MNGIKRAIVQQKFGKMADSVLNLTEVIQLNICVKLNIDFFGSLCIKTKEKFI